jgi:aromatic ring-opening dioxygenase LigB subunit
MTREQLFKLPLRELRAIAQKIDPFFPVSINGRPTTHADVISFILTADAAATNDNDRNNGYDITDSDYDEQMGGY